MILAAGGGIQWAATSRRKALPKDRVRCKAAGEVVLPNGLAVRAVNHCGQAGSKRIFPLHAFSSVARTPLQTPTCIIPLHPTSPVSRRLPSRPPCLCNFTVAPASARHVSTPDEVLFFYQEHFVDRVYLRHGVKLKPGDTVLDVGANIGVFAMAAAEACGPSGRVISSEPIPSVAEACRENIKRHAAWCQERGVPVAPVEVINVAAGDGSCQEAEFTVYERASGWSTMSPDEDETINNMEAYLNSRLDSFRALRASKEQKQQLPQQQQQQQQEEQQRQQQQQQQLWGPSLTTSPSALVASNSSNSEERSSGSRGGRCRGDGSSAAQEPVGLVEKILLPAAGALQDFPFARGALNAVAKAYIQLVLMGGKQQVKCRVMTLNQILRDCAVERVSLFKVDVERAELLVLKGLHPTDWRLVDQVAMEVHDEFGGCTENGVQRGGGGGGGDGVSSQGAGGCCGPAGGRLGQVQVLLAEMGFEEVHVEQDEQLEGTTLYNVYALRC